MSDKVITNGLEQTSTAWLREMNEMEREEVEVLDQLAQASLDNKRKDIARWSVRACDKTLAEFELLGFTGFICRKVDGEVVFEGYSDCVPAFLAKEVA